MNVRLDVHDVNALLIAAKQGSFMNRALSNSSGEEEGSFLICSIPLMTAPNRNVASLRNSVSHLVSSTPTSNAVSKKVSSKSTTHPRAVTLTT